MLAWSVAACLSDDTARHGQGRVLGSLLLTRSLLGGDSGVADEEREHFDG